jgi:hypothetical protein
LPERYSIEIGRFKTMKLEVFKDINKKIFMKIHAILLLLFSLISSLGSGSTYYVATSGNDSYSGTYSQPWLTIQHAADMLIAGDTVFIRNGVYSEQVIMSNGGDAINGHIVFSAYQNDDVVIDGTGVGTGNNGFIIQSSYVKVLKLTVRNWASTGIWVIGPVGFIEISNCKVHDTGGCISFSNGVHDFELNKNEMYNFFFYGFDSTSDLGQPDSYNGTINDCYSHDGDPTQNCDGFAFGHSWHRNIVFNRCVADKVYDGFDITGHMITLNSCHASNCGNGGYKLWSDSLYLVNCIGYGNIVSNVELDADFTINPIYNPKKVTLTNCTFFNSGGYNVQLYNPGWGDSLYMYNCILAGGDNIGISFEEENISTYRGDYNVFHNDNRERLFTTPLLDIPVDSVQSGYWTNITGQDANSKVVYDLGTLFLGTLLPDLHLRTGAVAIDNGTAAGAPSIDYDGCPRPYNAIYDIGAYEYPPCPLGLEEDNLPAEDNYLFQNFPNPCSGTTLINISIPVDQHVELRIIDLFGKEVSELLNKKMRAGNYEVEFDASHFSSGIYFYGISTEKYSEYRKMLVVH